MAGMQPAASIELCCSEVTHIFGLAGGVCKELRFLWLCSRNEPEAEGQEGAAVGRGADRRIRAAALQR